MRKISRLTLFVFLLGIILIGYSGMCPNGDDGTGSSGNNGNSSGSSGRAPIVTTSGATNITHNSATLNGTVSPNKLTTEVYFEYGPDHLIRRGHRPSIARQRLKRY
ncbi:MAG: hypothetical protein HY762_01465 [Planctomycetes bacterium]|nr:hypothetical protein [Planctomycetota bacterium]